MEKQSLISRLRAALNVGLTYWGHHAASREAMEATYTREWREAETGDEQMIRLTICPFGSIYQVTMAHYTNGLFKQQESWLASYGWNHNGYLMTIGRECYLMFNPAQRQLYLLEYKFNGEITVDHYQQA